MTTSPLPNAIVEPLIPKGRGTRKCHYKKDVTLEGPVWRLNDQFESHFVVDWRKLGFAHRGLAEATADFIVDRIVSSSASNVVNHYRAICKLQTLGSFRSWANALLPRYRGDLNHVWFYEARDSGRWSRGELSHVRRWFRFCSKREESGVSWASGMTLAGITIGGDPKAVAVLTNDPKEGPLDDAETTSLLQALLSARTEGSIDLAGIASVWLCVILGPNPRHLAFLREEDFKRIDGRHPELWVPRIKGKDAPGRTEFRRRKLDEFAAKLIEDLIEENAVRRQIEPWSDDKFGLALFARRSPRMEVLGLPQHAYAIHKTPDEISKLVSETVTALNVHSPRTGRQLEATPRRFRYTFATRLLREGASLEVIRDLLDHTDLQTVSTYLNLRGDIIEKLDAALDLELAPVAQAFMGTLVVSENEALRGDTCTSRIFNLDREKREAEGIGTCGSFSFCGLAAPRACYTCGMFQPWIDGPHDMVLRGLLTDREERRGRGLNGRLVSMNDHTILAVADVVRRCAEAKAGVPVVVRDTDDPAFDEEGEV